ncbi:MAG: RusA family crossover junction endodeoxyribonuclease [Deltaproteobacteria bacterium]|nr:RusA family crossover junction endodeoxyribonuclease [Deltaproteobacteria bacterium]
METEGLGGTDITVKVWIVPRPQKRPRAVRTGAGARAYKDPGQARDAANLVAALLESRPERPIEGPVRVGFEACFTLPKSVPKRRRAWMLGGFRHVTKPDVDNLGKFLLDCLQEAQYFRDDRQVTQLWGAKRYVEGAGYWEMTVGPAL